MSGRRTRGRQRIPIRRIENQDDLHATFSKRRLGIYKRASELSTICGADIGVVIFSPSNNPFSFFSPTMESVINRYENPNQAPGAFERMVDDHTRIRIRAFNRRLDEVLDKKEELKQRERYLDEIDRTRQKGWWEQVPVESLNKEQLQQWKAWFETLRSQVTNRIEELKNGGSSSSVFQQQNAPNFPYEHAAANTSTPAVDDISASADIFSQNFVLPSAAYTPTSANIFSQSFVPPSATLLPTSEAMIAGQFPSPYLSSGGGSIAGISDIPSQHHVSPQAQDPFVAGSSIDPFAAQYDYFPPQTHNLPTQVPLQAQDPFVFGSSTNPFATQYDYFPPQDQNPSTHIQSPFIASSSIERFATQYDDFHPQAQNPSTHNGTGTGTGEDGPSNINP